MKNKVQLITYTDRLGGGNLNSLNQILHEEFRDVFGGVHLLPFFTPIDGADAGFDPIDHLQVDPRLGDWQDLANLSKTTETVADLIVNHVSCHSPMFRDVLEKAEESPYFDLFLKLDDVYPSGVSEKQLLEIYRPRPGLPFTPYKLESGSSRLFWTTFTPEQIDINVHSDAGKLYLESILDKFEEANVKMIRLDATGYAVKKPDSNCFMLEETFDFIEELRQKAHSRNIKTLVEIHTYYQTQVEIAKKVDYVYDFALPPLVLHTLFSKNAKALKEWLAIAPKNCITVLDTHDGIGVIDVGPDSGRDGLLTEEEINNLVETIHRNSCGQSKMATGAVANNVDLYQVNCTYYDALGKNDTNYLIARAIQFFCPGIPQVYYVGLLAGCNDMGLLQETNVGRDINRHFFSKEEIRTSLEFPIVKSLLKLIRFRNQHPAFDGDFKLLDSDDHVLRMEWNQGADFARLVVDVPSGTWHIESSASDAVKEGY